MTKEWVTRQIPVVNLYLDSKNPRLSSGSESASSREIIQQLFDFDKAYEVAESIAHRGFFANEPLLAVREDERYIVVEGNRRLAALKALREPGVLSGTYLRSIERLVKKFESVQFIERVPVIIAPDRRSTDPQIAGKHVGTPVLAWQAENRARFILEKLNEGYSSQELQDELNFSTADIQAARQTRAIAEIARSLDLPPELKEKVLLPRTKLFTTIERVIDSTVGREYLKIEPDAENGFRGKTTKAEFLKGFRKLVYDVAKGDQSSRTLNTNDDIKKYFDSLSPEDLPLAKRGTFLPSDLISDKKTQAVPASVEKSKPQPKTQKIHETVLPRSLKIVYGNPRIIDIRDELVNLKRVDHPNAGAVLLRVFFELSVMHYLERTGELAAITLRLKEKGKIQHDQPSMKQIIPEIIRITKGKLSTADAERVEKAIKYDSSAPFTLSDLHSFVHQKTELPGERDILQFWLRVEPLFRLMLEKDSA